MRLVLNLKANTPLSADILSFVTLGVLGLERWKCYLFWRFSFHTLALAGCHSNTIFEWLLKRRNSKHKFLSDLWDLSHLPTQDEGSRWYFFYSAAELFSTAQRNLPGSVKLPVIFSVNNSGDNHSTNMPFGWSRKFLSSTRAVQIFKIHLPLSQTHSADDSRRTDERNNRREVSYRSHGVIFEAMT